MTREGGEVAVIAVGDDDAVVVADHDDSRHGDCSSDPPLCSRLVCHCFWTIFLTLHSSLGRITGDHYWSFVA